LWNLDKETFTKLPNHHIGAIREVAFSPDGKWLLSGSFDKTIAVYDAKTGVEVERFQNGQIPVYCVQISPDGSNALSGDYRGILRQWRLAGA
jgi:WD40 repeat protein